MPRAPSSDRSFAVKSNEIPAERPLLATFELTSAVVTVDAMHIQLDTAAAIVNAGGDYVFMVNADQPTLHSACKKLPWAAVRGHTAADRSQGRRTTCTVKVLDVPA